MGDQGNKQFWEEFISKTDMLDIIIDDGSHKMSDIKITFEMMYDRLNPGGVYLCEDLHCAYWKDYEGGLKEPGSFLELVKDLTDALNYKYYQSSEKEKEFGMKTNSIHFYDSIVIIEKS